jgi:hypothetical protein
MLGVLNWMRDYFERSNVGVSEVVIDVRGMDAEQSWSLIAARLRFVNANQEVVIRLNGSVLCPDGMVDPLALWAMSRNEPLTVSESDVCAVLS